MANFSVGLDFGTYQTKVCVNHIDRNPQKFEFFEFKNETNSLFILSKVFLLENNKLRYGEYDGEDIKHVFNYFKIASAVDEEFIVSSDVDGKSGDTDPLIRRY